MFFSSPLCSFSPFNIIIKFHIKLIGKALCLCYKFLSYLMPFLRSEEEAFYHRRFYLLLPLFRLKRNHHYNVTQQP
jgi:hypothetical protein